jgi:hypothetical protein
LGDDGKLLTKRRKVLIDFVGLPTNVLEKVIVHGEALGGVRGAEGWLGVACNDFKVIRSVVWLVDEFRGEVGPPRIGHSTAEESPAFAPGVEIESDNSHVALRIHFQWLVVVLEESSSNHSILRSIAS